MDYDDFIERDCECGHVEHRGMCSRDHLTYYREGSEIPASAKPVYTATLALLRMAAQDRRCRVSRAALIIGALLSLALSGCGCSIDSAVNPPKGMRCTSAHDQYHDGGTTLVCDTYSPMPGGER